MGRINEVGEIHAAAPDIMAGTGPIEDQYIAGELSPDRFNSWIDNGSRSEITRTSYDEATAPSISGFIQTNLQKRVSATYVDNKSNTGDGYEHATYYSYDIHGNVKSLLQENPKVWTGNDAHRFKQIDYEYDLISGNVKKVSYQDGHLDAFYHKYLYDADNRITHVYTSKDKVIWDEDVKYFYYKHGPLARTELGNENLVITLRGVAETVDGIHSLIEPLKALYPDRNLNPTTIRQSVISNLLNEKKIPLEDVQLFAGHKWPSITEKYRRNDISEQRALINSLHPLDKNPTNIKV